MQRTDYKQFACSIARTFDVVGEPWTALIVRDLYFGVNRFDEIHRDLGVSRKVLSARLETLVGNQVAERVAYEDHPPRYEYVLTDRGRELMVALLPIMAWGDYYLDGGDGPPATLTHDSCGHEFKPEVACSECAEPIHADDVTVTAGPGGRHEPGTELIAELLTTGSLSTRS
jgi:DNA-binding HxlR family transcriptional regulator